MPDETPHVERSPDEVIPEKPGKDYVYPPPETMRRAGWAMSEAIRKVDKRMRNRLSPNYLSVANDYGLKRGALKTTFSLWRQGKVILMKTREELLVVDKKVELESKLQMFDELEVILNGSLRLMIDRSRKYLAKGKPLAYRDMGIPLVLQDMSRLTNLRNLAEKGFLDVLGQLNREKKIKAAVADVPTVATPISRDEMGRRAAEALKQTIDEREAREAAEKPADS